MWSRWLNSNIKYIRWTIVLLKFWIWNTYKLEPAYVIIMWVVDIHPCDHDQCVHGGEKIVPRTKLSYLTYKCHVLILNTDYFYVFWYYPVGCKFEMHAGYQNITRYREAVHMAGTFTRLVQFAYMHGIWDKQSPHSWKPITLFLAFLRKSWTSILYMLRIFTHWGRVT